MAYLYPNLDKKPSSLEPLAQLSAASSWSSSLLLSLNYLGSHSLADYSSIGLYGDCSLKATISLIHPRYLLGRYAHYYYRRTILAIAEASRGDWGLVIFGLVLSIPIMVGGSILILKLMKKAPWIIVVGCGLLAIIAGRMILDDRWVREQIMPPDFSASPPNGSAFSLLPLSLYFLRVKIYS